MFDPTTCWVNLQKLYKLPEKRKGDKQGFFLDSGLDTSNCGISTVSFGNRKRYPTPYIRPSCILTSHLWEKKKGSDPFFFSPNFQKTPG